MFWKISIENPSIMIPSNNRIPPYDIIKEIGAPSTPYPTPRISILPQKPLLEIWGYWRRNIGSFAKRTPISFIDDDLHHHHHRHRWEECPDSKKWFPSWIERACIRRNLREMQISKIWSTSRPSRVNRRAHRTPVLRAQYTSENRTFDHSFGASWKLEFQHRSNIRRKERKKKLDRVMWEDYILLW